MPGAALTRPERNLYNANRTNRAGRAPESLPPESSPPGSPPPESSPPESPPPESLPLRSSPPDTPPPEASPPRSPPGSHNQSPGLGVFDGIQRRAYSRPRKRTAAEAGLKEADNERPAEVRLEGEAPEDDGDPDEDELEEDEEGATTRFDVEFDDAFDMPRVGEEVLEPFPTASTFNAHQPRYRSTLMMVIVDTSGVHELPVVFCACPNAPARDIQLLRMGLYPATWRRPQTAFTFRVLDDFLLTNKECKTPAYSYYSRLRRITSETFPHMVPVRLALAQPIYPTRLTVDTRRIATETCCASRGSGGTSRPVSWRQLATQESQSLDQGPSRSSARRAHGRVSI